MPNAIFVEVAIPVPLRQLFTYAVPEKMVNSPITLGERVIVPFGPRKVVGIVMATPKHDQLSKDVDLSKIKPIIARVADKYHFDSQLLNLLKLAANYYHHPIGDVFKTSITGSASILNNLILRLKLNISRRKQLPMKRKKN